MKKFLIVFGIIIIILVAIGGIGSVLLVKWYNNNLLPVKDANSSESIQVEKIGRASCRERVSS